MCLNCPGRGEFAVVLPCRAAPPPRLNLRHQLVNQVLFLGDEASPVGLDFGRRPVHRILLPCRVAPPVRLDLGHQPVDQVLLLGHEAPPLRLDPDGTDVLQQPHLRGVTPPPGLDLRRRRVPHEEVVHGPLLVEGIPGDDGAGEALEADRGK